ncbi:MAG: type IV toxin-antitoxin system AbiEi family antitoxin [Thermoleophilia bacterium]|nr:type IV toxin-antitoxin system AbiEi family antitoxin [Thermoleophilia bacterium]
MERIDERRVRLSISESGRLRLEVVGVALAVPHPSGLVRLLAAEPGAEAVVVERLSPGLAEAARQRGVGVIDLAGQGCLSGPGLVYMVLPSARRSRRPEGPDPGDRPALISGGRGVSPFAPRASRLVRILLHDPGCAWGLSELARRAEMNPGNAHRVLAALADQGLVEREGDRYMPVDPGSMLEAWSDSASRRRRRSPGLLLSVAEGLEAHVLDLAQAIEGAVVSGEIAAERYAPYLPAAGAVLHCPDPAAFERAAILIRDRPRPLRPSGSIRIDVGDDGVGDFSQLRDGLRLASPAQVYVDLAGERGRGREAADHLRREVLRF